MKKSRSIIIGVLICIGAMGIAYFWTSSLMNSLYAYRSPLQNTPPKPSAPLGKPHTRSFVIVLIDGLRYDTSLDAEVMPFLNQLRNAGAHGLMHSRPPSYSQPGYSVILIGAWPDISDGPAMNLNYDDIPAFTQDNLFSAAYRAGLHTAVSSYYWFEKLIPRLTVSASFYTKGEDKTADEQVTEAAIPWLRDGQYQLMLIHLDQVDYAGHYEGGPIDPHWEAAATRVDQLLEQIATTMDLTQDTILVISDHGQIDPGGHGGQDPIVLMEPFVMVGKGVIPGNYGDMQMVDVAPTVASILGTSIPATNQGHPLIAMYDFSLDEVDAINNQLSTQQSQLARLYQEAIGEPVNVVRSQDIVTSTQTAMDEARESRLNIQRLPRGIIAFTVIFFLVSAAAWRARPYYNWMLIGVVCYILVFNIKYLLIDHKTYSLSSVSGATDLIASTALTALLALFVAWLVTILGTKIYQFKPRKAANLTLTFVLVTLSILVIPVMVHFFVNGAIVTWALPNFLISFLGLLFLIQILMVAAIGLFLTGISHLLGFFARGK